VDRTVWSSAFPAIASTDRSFGRHGLVGILGYARVSTGDQDVAGQRLRLEGSGSIRVFTNVISGIYREMKWVGMARPA
jgi:hypothetical protein